MTINNKWLFIGRLRGVYVSSIIDEGIRDNFFYKKISHAQKAQNVKQANKNEKDKNI